ncbi:restriction endonuclease subunit S [Anaerotignum lactatifermentans]|uniref:restriction endonuclease subunit S n=1 Tax=Anaerotignum lactatifermentans TaxID=160404 RepID=UPI003AB21FCB
MKIYSLQEVATIIAGQSPNSKYYNTDGNGIPFFQGKTDFGDLYPKVRVYCTNPIKIAEKNDILLSVRAPVGPTNLSPGKVCIGRGLTAIRPNEKIRLKYLLYFFRYFETQLQRQGTGTTFKAITQNVIKNLKIPVPSLPEQERIVARIEELFSELDKAVETLKTTQQQLAVYRQAVYASIFDHGTLRPITDFFEISGGLTKNSKRHEFHTKMPYLRVANVYYNFLDLREIKQIGVMPNEIERTLLQKDDLLFVEGNGSKSQIGRVAIWDGSIKNCLHQNHLIKGRPIGGMLPKYALFYLISGYGRKQILDIASSTSGLYTLSINKIKNLKIPYIDIDDQKKSLELIDSRLSCCDQIERTVDTALQQAEAMRQSILKQAFEGGL